MDAVSLPLVAFAVDASLLRPILKMLMLNSVGLVVSCKSIVATYRQKACLIHGLRSVVVASPSVTCIVVPN